MDEVAAPMALVPLGRTSVLSTAAEQPTSRRSLSVLHVHSGNLFGGIERAILTCVENLHLAPSIQFEFALCFNGQFSEQLAASGQTIYKLADVRTRNPLSILAVRRQLTQLLQRKRYDVVICHSPWAHSMFAPVIRRDGKPELFWAHGRFAGEHWLERWARRSKPDFVIANSNYSDESVAQIFPGIPHQVLRCPVGTDRIILSAAERSRIRAEFATPDDAVVIVQVSRMEPGKGHKLLLSAAEKLPDDLNWFIWFVGAAQRNEERAYFEGLQAIAARSSISGRVRFVGERNDVPKLFAAADLLCQPNASPDSFGLVFIEALSQALPVLTFVMGGPAEIVDERCGILAQPGNQEQLTAGLARLVSSYDLRRTLGEAGPRRAKALCDPAVILPQLEAVISQLSPTKRS